MSHSEKESNSHPPSGGNFIYFIIVQSVTCIPLFSAACTATCQDCISIHWVVSKFNVSNILCVGGTIQASHRELSPFPAFNFSQPQVLFIRCPSYWSFTFSIRPSSEHLRLISFRKDWFYLFAAKVLSTVFYNTTVHKHQFFGAQLSL